MTRLFFFVMLFASLGARGETILPEDHAALIDAAIAALDSDLSREWSYIESSTDNENTTVARFDPRRPDDDQWLLLSVDGRQPTDEEIKSYSVSKQHDNGSSSGDDDRDNGINDLVERDSLTLIDETADYWLFSFVPKDEDEHMGVLKHLDASLRIVKDGRYIDLIDMHSSKPLRPAFGVKIKEFLMRLSFGPAADNGPIVPRTVDVRVKGRAYLFAGFDEAESATFSDFEYVGD